MALEVSLGDRDRLRRNVRTDALVRLIVPAAVVVALGVGVTTSWPVGIVVGVVLWAATEVNRRRADAKEDPDDEEPDGSEKRPAFGPVRRAASIVETVHSRRCQQCGPGTDLNSKVGDDGRAIRLGEDCPCVADFDEACMPCRGETLSPSVHHDEED